MYFCSWFLRGIHLKAGTSHDFSKFSIGSMYIVLEKKGLRKEGPDI